MTTTTKGTMLRTTTIVWEDPPLARRRVLDYDAVVAELARRPGEWARVFVSEHGDKKAAVAVSQGLQRRGLWTTQRSIDDVPVGTAARGGSTVLGRYAVWAMVPESTTREGV